jgi:hypothetical protein
MQSRVYKLIQFIQVNVISVHKRMFVNTHDSTTVLISLTTATYVLQTIRKPEEFLTAPLATLVTSTGIPFIHSDSDMNKMAIMCLSQ